VNSGEECDGEHGVARRKKGEASGERGSRLGFIGGHGLVEERERGGGCAVTG
jgi:hypothetical protein